MKARYQCAADLLDSWRDDVLSGKAPVLYPLGKAPLDRLEIGPGLVVLFGGAPGAGKTAFSMQCTIDALRLTRELRALVCNVEMRAATLLDRQLARLSGVSLSVIRHRRLTAEHADRIDQGLNTLQAIADRLCFLRSPFDLENVAAAADEFHAGLLVLDYIQRIHPPGNHENRRGSLDATMNYLRQFADADVAVIVVSAVGRSKDKHGRNSYDAEGLSLASFRESSELEFGADSAFILASDGGADSPAVTLKHLKDRHGAVKDISLLFDRARQSFSGAQAEPAAERGKLSAAVAQLWQAAEPAADDAEATP
ncbi:MAG: AAA family ATPase [Candidatus Hydrogenedentes bacterium]|nr:AAA family ATPase [Candidatus Hydrogenedentota bacterium]